MKEVKISIIIELEKMFIPKPLDDFEEQKTSVQGVTSGVMEIAGELEMESDDEAELQQSCDETLIVEELLLMGERRKYFSKWNLLLMRTLGIMSKMTAKNV